MKQTPIDTINNLQEIIIVNCYVYYELDDNVLSDVQFDHVCNKLIGWMNHKDFKKSKHYELFKDFSMATRFNISETKNKKWLNIAQQVVDNQKYIDV